MHYTALGLDEQAPAPIFVRLVTPTDLERSRAAMVDCIKGYHPGTDWLNLALWRKLGMSGEPVVTFLKNYMVMARTSQQTPTRADLPLWKGRYLGRYPGSIGEDVEDYFNALMDTRAAGLIADTIFTPWTYEPQTLTQEAAAALAVPIKAGFDKLLVAATIAGTIYLLGRYALRRMV